MRDHCFHKFLWPRRAKDGQYYQSCLLCGAEYAYDWKNMRRIESGQSQPKTPCTSRLLSSSVSDNLRTPPRLRLLLELEPAHRVFFQNLADTLLFRSTSPMLTTSKPGPFWNDVFVYSSAPWRHLVESMFCHIMVIAAALVLFQLWVRQEPPQQQKTLHKWHVSYYTPSQSFPALGSSQARISAQPRNRRPAPQAVLRVAPERGQRNIKPPDIKLAQSMPSNIVSSNPVAPAMPPSAIRRSQLVIPAGPTWVVAAPPGLDQVIGRQHGLPQASVIAPPPDVGAVSSRHSVAAANESVVAPPLSVEGSMHRVGNVNLGNPAVVAPPAQLPASEHAGSGPNQAVALGSLATSAVPPPPIVTPSGTLADGRASSISGNGLQVAPPSSSVQGAGYPGKAAQQVAMAVHPSPASPKLPAVENSHTTLTEDLPIRVIGLVLALPSSSYFSNYEVFVAERRISKVASQLIKLVYVSLPYQRRLSEYGLNSSRVYKLRVRRDRTCDESLLQMTWPETDPHPGSQYSSDSPGLTTSDRNDMLPCYCTTADDYRRAISRDR
jgi:hypothetical protein